MPKIIDIRSDTQTRPTKAMYEAIGQSIEGVSKDD